MKTIILSLCLATVSIWTVTGQTPDPQPPRTDLAKDVYVELSASDFALEMTPMPSSSQYTQAYRLAAPESGTYTLLTFLNGKLWRLESVQLNGYYRINTRGLAPGQYRLTLQAVAADGRLGSATQPIVVK